MTCAAMVRESPRAARLREMESRCEAGLAEAREAVRVVVGERLWAETHDTFDAWLAARFGVGANHARSLLGWRMPERLRQRTMFEVPGGDPAADTFLAAVLAAAARGPDDLASEMRGQSETLAERNRLADEEDGWASQLQLYRRSLDKIRLAAKDFAADEVLKPFEAELRAVLEKATAAVEARKRGAA